MLKHWLILVLSVFSVHTAWAEDLESFANSPVWQRLYQYKNNKSKIEAPVFFFSLEGMHDPLKELNASIEAYKDTKKLYGTLQTPAACAFPARKLLIEKNLGLKFPDVKCKDLDDWINQFDADTLAIDFAGAYSGNPASILGHTFLRYYNDKKTRLGHDLLSYAVGFLAVSDPKDSRAMYMIRGLLGQYPGYYQIEKYYMKVGIYNNSESRDIWEQKLNLTPEEVRFSLMLLWEYTFNSKIPYYFVDENCSYRLLTLLEVVRPSANLISKLSPVVLPADTVRVLIKNGLADPNPKFRSSILRRLNQKVENLNVEEKKEFEGAKKSLQLLNDIKSAKVLDALIDFWTYTNYRAETNLKEKDSEIMEATFLKRSKLPEVSSATSDDDLRQKEKLIPTYLGHKTSWVSLSGGSQNIGDTDHVFSQFSYRMGAHAMTDAQPGYEGITAIEYLGFDIEPHGVWRALLVDTKSIEPLNNPEKKWSWLAEVGLNNNESILSDTRLITRGGGGGAYGISSAAKIYFMPELASEIWVSDQPDAIMGIGFESGIIFNLSKQNILLRNESVWNHLGYYSKSNFTYSFHYTVNNTVFAKFEINDLISENSSHGWWVGYKVHF